jgi:hypothetical protein
MINAEQKITFVLYLFYINDVNFRGV